MPHVVLVGDSIFDNASYSKGAPDVVGHLRSLISAEWLTTLLAVDGSTTDSVASQLNARPATTSHIVLSIGGNDALLNADLLDTPVRSTAEALAIFGERTNQFEARYRAVVAALKSTAALLTVCTIYNGNLSPKEAPLARVALMLFNDVILRVAFENRLSVVDLRSVCTEPADYANPLEPSGVGGEKIAAALWSAIRGQAGAAGYSRVYGRAHQE